MLRDSHSKKRPKTSSNLYCSSGESFSLTIPSMISRELLDLFKVLVSLEGDSMADLVQPQRAARAEKAPGDGKGSVRRVRRRSSGGGGHWEGRRTPGHTSRVAALSGRRPPRLPKLEQEFLT